MKKLLLICYLLIAIIPLQAEDTIRNLIFTEWRGDQMTNAYVELTNMGDAPVDLSRFTLATITPNVTFPTADSRHRKRLEGILAPGESYLIMTVYEGNTLTGIPFTRTKMLPLADLKVYVVEGGVQNDSISTFDRLLRLFNGIYASVLWYNLENGDSVIVDAVNNAIDVNTGRHFGVPGSVAGVEGATYTHTLVRKSNIKTGNPNWDNARGVSLEDSEWLPVPHDGTNPDGDIFTTVKSHGNFNISLESSTIGINLNDTILTVPWEILKGDSILDWLNLGPNMAWRYIESSESFDSAFNNVRTGDKLIVYAFGDKLHKMDFKIIVSTPASNLAKIFPLRNRNFTTGGWTMTSRYYVTSESPVIDTIGNVPYATRIDTLFTYLLKAPLANWEITWVDEKERIDLKNGDILKVTAQDGTTHKQYFIDVQDYLPSSNAFLSGITWPDIPNVLEGWIQDTIPFFQQDRYSYFIKLPYGSSMVPALKAYTQNLNANVTIKRALSLKGSVDDRTMVFTVTAEDGITKQDYAVTFEVEKGEEQVFKAEPFISQIVHKHFSQNSFIELTNPGNVPLSLDEYIVVQSNTAGSPASALSANLVNDATNWGRRYYKYVPGFRFQSLENWTVNPGLLDLDPAIDPSLNPGEVFVIGRLHNNEVRRPAEQTSVDIHFSATLANVWGETGWNNNALCWTQTYSIFYLFKILNDSVLEGKKPVGDPADYLLIDMFGSAAAENWTVGGLTTSSDGWSFIRKPSVWKGNPESKGSWGTTPDDSEWNVVVWGGTGTDWAPVSAGIGTHVNDPVSVYISTVSSLNYQVSDGFDGLQTIQGEMTGLSLENFLGLIVKANPGQVLVMKNGTDGSVKNPTDIVAGGDTLLVTSADGVNVTKYLIISSALDTDAVLAAKDGSGYQVVIDGQNGTITGMKYGVPLVEVLDNLVKPTSATLNLLDESDHLVPFKVLNFDTIYVNVKTGGSYFIEVIAQDGVTKILYEITPAALASDAFVISTLFEVDQDSLVITDVPFGLSLSSFLRYIEASGNATLKITDKTGLERLTGTLAYDDRLVVTSEDLSNTVVYSIDFINEINPDRYVDPTINISRLKHPEDNLLVFPNPTDDRIYIKGLEENERVMIIDGMGRVVKIFQSDETSDGISLYNEPSGVYLILSLDNKGAIKRTKVIKR